MIRKLRRKFIIILMCVVALILLAVFASILISSWSNSQRMSENMLRQALILPADPSEIQPPPNGLREGFAGGRMPFLVVDVDKNEEIVFIMNQLHFMDESEARTAVVKAINTNRPNGVMYDYELRWLKSDDGRRIAFVDISMEQEILKNLITNSLLIGIVSLAAFYLISLFLARWAVRPVERAWERQRQFVADASHELKTPLTVILSNADMLSGDGIFTDEKKARRMEHIQAEAVRMRQLVEDLLVLAKTDSTESTRIHEQVDFSFIVTSAVLTFEPIVFDEQKELTCDVQDNIFVAGDAQRLQQLIGILLDNAVKYCPQGGKIKVGLNASEKKTVLLAVTNDGEPIPKEELSQVFERFYRIDKSRSDHGGFGLGLSIADGIVKEHNGKIWAKSDERTGNSFFILLPQE